MGTFIREKKTYCGKEYLEIDVYPLSDNHLKKKPSRKRENVTAPAQKNLNDKKARRYLCQLIKANFNTGDLHVTCTYRTKHMPKTQEEADKEVANFIRRINYQQKKKGLPSIKYIIITEGAAKSGNAKRIHHHIIMSKVNRELVEELWRKPRKKGEKVGEKIGFCNARRLQVDDDGGINALANYLVKDPQGRKRWKSSQNLTKPQVATADKKWSRRKLEKTAGLADDDFKFWEKQYPGWRMIRCESIYNEISGWSIYLELRRKE